jgi:hypothetical protein
MYVAHTAPAAGPANVLALSQYLTAPLFATLLGMGTWFSWQRLNGRADRGRRFAAAVAVRSVALIVVGVLLERLPAHVLVVLVHLGLLTVIAALLVRLSPRFIAAVGVAFAVLGAQWARHETTTLLGNAAFGDYGLTHMIPWACLGIILARRSDLTRGWLGSRPRKERTRWQSIRGDVGVMVGALVVAAALLVGRWAGEFLMFAYQRNLQEIVFDALLSTAVVCGCAVLVRLGSGPLVRAVATAGAMTLTLYVGQVLVLAVFAALNPDTSDNSWAMLAGLALGSVVFAVLWHGLVRAGPFARGPLEGVVDLGVRAGQRRRSAPPEDAGIDPRNLGSRR